MENISVRIEAVDELDEFTGLIHENRSGTIRELLNQGRKMKALELYKEKKVSLGLAAKLANVTLSEFIDLLHEFNMTLNIGLDEAKESLEYARKVMK